MSQPKKHSRQTLLYTNKKREIMWNEYILAVRDGLVLWNMKR